MVVTSETESKMPRSSTSSRKECVSASHDSDTVRVVARIRPLNSKERNEESKNAINNNEVSQPNTVSVENHSRVFEYDAVFGPESTQLSVYEQTAGDTVQKNIFKGFNVTILAYGQTGSGKTYTMGTEGGNELPTPTNSNESLNAANVKPTTKLTPPSEEDGIIPRAVYDLFKTRSDMKNGKGRVKVEMSYLEIYNEVARDLLMTGDSDAVSDLQIRESKTEGVVVQNLSRYTVQSPKEVREMMNSGSQRRVTASTMMNSVSSRSHAICTLYVTISPPSDAQEQEPKDPDFDGEADEEIRAKLTLVDLAGSERIKRTGAEGERMKEGININKGLFVLGQVISTLSEIGQQQSSSNLHIPYRDSKLTRLLQDSLGGNSKTVMLACVSPADSNIEESINTLRYAERARNIKNAAVRNVTSTTMTPAEAVALRKENQMLKLRLMEAQMRLGESGAVASGATVVTKGVSASSLSPTSTINENLQGVDVSKLEIVTRLRAKVASLESRMELLKEKNSKFAEEALTFSLKADKWQLKHENLIATMKKKNIHIPEGVLNNVEGEILAENLRKEVLRLKGEIREACVDAEVARATAAAVVMGEGNLSAVEQVALSSVEEGLPSEEDSDGIKNEELSAELVAVSSSLEKKEAMAVQINKERDLMDHLKGHFEEAIRRLQEEVDTLASEKDLLAGTLGNSHDGVTTNEENKKMRERIKELEKRIKAIKSKSAEHKRSLRMREITEKKCIQLASEIAESKKRRIQLQRLLKEAGKEHRSERKAAKQQAAKLLRDSQKLKHELNKVKETAARQNKILKRKAVEAISKQKRLTEQQRKMSNAAAVRAGRLSNSDKISTQKQEELIMWLENELNASNALKGIRGQIEEQALLLEETSFKQKNLLSQGEVKTASIEATLRSLEDEIKNRNRIIEQLEQNCEEVYKSVIGNSGVAPSPFSRFIDVATWRNLSRSEIRLISCNIFDRLIQANSEIISLKNAQRESNRPAIEKAVLEERRVAEDTRMNLQIEHAEAMTALLESTRSTVKRKVRENLLSLRRENSSDSSIQSAIDDILSSYLNTCEEANQNLKGEIYDIRERLKGMKNFVDSVAKDLIANNEAVAAAKKKTKKKIEQTTSEIEEDFDIFDEDMDIVEDSDDSDWNPDSPDPKRRRSDSRSKQEKRKESSSSLSEEKDLARGAIAERNGSVPLESLEYEKMTVAQLKEILKKQGKTVSGKKAELIKRLSVPGPCVNDRVCDSKENSKPNNEGVKKNNADRNGGRKQPLGDSTFANINRIAKTNHSKENHQCVEKVFSRKSGNNRAPGKSTATTNVREALSCNRNERIMSSKILGKKTSSRALESTTQRQTTTDNVTTRVSLKRRPLGSISAAESAKMKRKRTMALAVEKAMEVANTLN